MAHLKKYRESNRTWKRDVLIKKEWNRAISLTVNEDGSTNYISARSLFYEFMKVEYGLYNLNERMRNFRSPTHRLTYTTSDDKKCCGLPPFRKYSTFQTPGLAKFRTSDEHGLRPRLNCKMTFHPGKNDVCVCCGIGVNKSDGIKCIYCYRNIHKKCYDKFRLPLEVTVSEYSSKTAIVHPFVCDQVFGGFSGVHGEMLIYSFPIPTMQLCMICGLACSNRHLKCQDCGFGVHKNCLLNMYKLSGTYFPDEFFKCSKIKYLITHNVYLTQN